MSCIQENELRRSYFREEGKHKSKLQSEKYQARPR
jgi:hypothetical protein